MTWSEVLAPIKSSEYFGTLWTKVNEQYKTQKCFPPKNQIFRAIELTPFDEVEVVIIGQDPYHNDGQANGLCFSVSESVTAPPSLKNIFIELKEDLNITRTKKELDDWAQQGVLLLNATLTVQAHQPNSHKDLGWEKFTDYIIQQISAKKGKCSICIMGCFCTEKSCINRYFQTSYTGVCPSVSVFCVQRILWKQAFFQNQPIPRNKREETYCLGITNRYKRDR